MCRHPILYTSAHFYPDFFAFAIVRATRSQEDYLIRSAIQKINKAGVRMRHMLCQQHYFVK